MQIQYEHLNYQKKAIDSVIQLFDGEPNHQQDGFTLIESNNEMVVANQLSLTWETIHKNLQQIQQNNGITQNDSQDTNLNFTIEMETGTGKTYVYLRTILQLNKAYGWRKFIIVVPSIAIREGVLQSLHSTKSHFADEFDNIVYHFNKYNSEKTNQIKQFAKSTQIDILVMNIQAFEKDQKNVINQSRENGKLIEFIQSTNPIVIIDEPQNISTDNRKNAIASLNPLFTVGYSATHKESYHKLYSLNPVQAYELNLVKQIAVRSVIGENDTNSTYLELIEITNKKGKLSAKIRILKNQKKETKKSIITVKTEDDLFEKSNKNFYYQGLMIDGLDLENQQLSLNNGKIIKKGDNINALKDEIMKTQIHETIKEHLKKEQQLKEQGIKVLSLFFIDKVKNYRTSEDGEKGKFYQWFEELYQKETGQSAEGVHKGYFSQDKQNKNIYKDTSGSTKADDNTYDLIMKAKERLLSFDEPLRFIFSHSALREGWDNPNVFQICTLNDTSSTLKKRQELGRGLRLPVNQYGQRIYDSDINILTVIPNESYEVFAKTLQKEYEDECGIRFDKSNIKNVEKERTVTYRFDAFSDSKFLDIWEKIRLKTRYKVNFDSQQLIQDASQAIREKLTLTAPKIRVQKANLKHSSIHGVMTTEIYDNSETASMTWQIPDVLKAVQDKTGLTRHTIFAILQQSQRLHDLTINPQKFIDSVSAIINYKLKKLMVDGISYEKIDDSQYEQTLANLFKTHKFFLNDHTFTVNKLKKTIYNKYIPLDSQTEKKFATDCENFDEQVTFYFKLPSWFKIPTPIGNYNPDWAVIINQNSQKLYFVAETKNTGKSVQEGIDTEKLRESENLKTECAKKHFQLAENLTYTTVEKMHDLLKHHHKTTHSTHD